MAPSHPQCLKIETILGLRFVEGNSVEVLRNGIEYFPAMLEALRESKHAIDFLTFVYWTGSISDEFANVLAAKAAAGVRTRVLLDAVGASSMHKELLEEMRSAGADAQFFRPISWRLWRNAHRTHRKVLICDDSVAFTGGVGVAEEWEGDARCPEEWRDTHFRIEGPAVTELRGAFYSNWLEDGRHVEVGDEPVRTQEAKGGVRIITVRTSASHSWSDVATAFRTVIQLAAERIWITAAYFVPDKRCTDLLRDAVGRGVDVRILTPGQHTDSRVSQLVGDSTVDELLAAGVKIFRFDPTTLHTKTIVIDSELAVIGSANFNQRSMQKDDEILLVVHDDACNSTLASHFQEDCERSALLDIDTWERRSVARRILEKLLQPFRNQV